MSGLASAANIPELRKRVVFTLLMLLVYRMGVQIPTPGINGDALTAFFEQYSGTLFGMFNMFSGGALENFSVFALGIMPYISASIIIQLLTVVIPQLEELKKEGEAGQRKITQYTRYGTVGLALIQGFFIASGLEAMTGPSGVPIVLVGGLQFKLMTVLTLTAGTSFIMWLGEQMTERGIGNGISLIIYAGIIARMPAAIGKSIQMVSSGDIPIIIVPVMLAMMFGVIAVIVYFETAQRRIPIQYAKRVVGRKVYGGQASHLPLKINISGVIPPIFASSIMMFPATIGTFIQIDWVQKASASLSPGTVYYYFLYVVMIVFFCFFYTAVTFNPDDVAENLKKNGGFIPGIRPGKRSAEFIDKVLTRITVVGAIYLAVVCVLPTILVSNFNVPFYFGGTALLIVVGVAIDTISKIESHLVMRNYEGFMKAGNIKGRR
ncbi:MAG: preprotein translocase subunit SecY [Candidatus Electrothrix sp. AW2]|jgi:preprotein translocase subunit SecY|nr:preprotein translocase subunit SecY [Candidatus Electrothrix sp. AX1]MCI5133776.1 preprotein translocase subunit SecY [Candidatus Electrothrix gigas]MCI5177725.1 preprotein translocase subunit SecY [Candidatus Electrothrix gigas]MCI5182271.1 preprotein translocase subunit SecY [Candidatus Electrothrix gigas]MCI5194175.1 preprotein translocase subunit SecY [Candidatus Electrothrix gigas]